MMKKIFLILVSVGLVLGCSKDGDEFVSAQEQLEIDVVKIDKYLAENNITAEIHDSGIRYVIDTVGTGTMPNESSSVVVTYEGRLMSNEEVFDGNTALEFSLTRVIVGWQKGIPLFKEGGSGTLYIPSGWAYGPNGRSPNIPGDAILIFDIELIEVK